LTMARIGGARGVINSLMFAEIGIVVVLAIICAGVLSVASLLWGGALLNSMVLQ